MKGVLFDAEPLKINIAPPLAFNDSFGDFIPLRDPVPLPVSDFLPSTDALAGTDCRRKSRNNPRHEAVVLYDVDDDDELGADNKQGGHSRRRSVAQKA